MLQSYPVFLFISWTEILNVAFVFSLQWVSKSQINLLQLQVFGRCISAIYFFFSILNCKIPQAQSDWMKSICEHSFSNRTFWPTHSNTWTCFGPNQWRQTPAFEGGWRTTSPHHDAATTLFYVNVTLPTCMSFWMGSKGRIQLTSFSVISKKGLNIDAYHNLF